MHCPRCRTPMVEQRGSHHKKRKWICPRCRKARMQTLRKPGKRIETLR